VRVLVVGAGAMGSMFGGLLESSGNHVILLDPNKDHIDAVKAKGLRLLHPDGTVQFSQVEATTSAFGIGPVDLVLVLTKSFSTRAAVSAITHSITDSTMVLTVQNGLGNDQVLSEVVGPEKVLGGTTTAGAKIIEPGMTELSPITAEGKSLTEFSFISTLDNPSPSALQHAELIAAVLTASGLPARLATSVSIVVWTKLCLAATAAPLTALLRCTVEDLINTPSTQRIMRDVFDEIVSVAHAEGVHLDADKVWHHLMSVFSAVGPHLTSMAVDVSLGRQTEIDSMSIEISRRGSRHGIKTPLNDAIGRLIMAIEEITMMQSVQPRTHQK